MNRKMPTTIAVGRHGIAKIFSIPLAKVPGKPWLGGEAMAVDSETDVRPGILIGRGRIAHCGTRAASM